MGGAAGLAAIGVGAVLGAWARWGLSVLLNAIVPTLPLGTLLSNLIGGYLIGVFLEFFLQHALLPAEWRLFVITGFLGSLTTFSTFSGESLALLMNHRYGWAMLHISAHLFGSLVMTLLGLYTVRWLTA